MEGFEYSLVKHLVLALRQRGDDRHEPDPVADQLLERRRLGREIPSFPTSSRIALDGRRRPSGRAMNRSIARSGLRAMALTMRSARIAMTASSALATALAALASVRSVAFSFWACLRKSSTLRSLSANFACGDPGGNGERSCRTRSTCRNAASGLFDLSVSHLVALSLTHPGRATPISRPRSPPRCPR